jgi:NADPH2:quinone reductase
MRFITTTATGGPEVLRLAHGPLPAVGADEVLIRVAAAGVNRPDALQRAGRYPPPAASSPVLGLEVAGEVVAVGSAVRTWKGHERVVALTNGGGYAEYCAVPAGQVLPWPAGLAAVEAAALPETYFTVWANVFDIGRLAAGQSLLVHGGGSGIGTTALQLGRAFGAEVYVTVGSAEKAAACLRLGAKAAILYHEQDFVAEIARLTAGRGVDLLLDMVGGPYFTRNLRCLAPGGRLLLIGLLGGGVAHEAELAPIMARQLVVTGSTLRPRTPAQKAAIAEALRAHVWPLLEAGRVRPVISAVLPLEEAAAAHAALEEHPPIGKIVLQVAGAGA